jgi:RNA polymerase sigma-70 factor (family 1)
LNNKVNSTTHFENIFEKHYKKLCRHALFYLRSAEDAEDVVQETFVKMWQERSQLFEQENDVVPYLYTAVKNNSISLLRKRFEAVSIDDDNSAVQIEDIQDSEYDNHKEDLHQRVMEAIEALPPKCAEVFKMHRLVGMSYKDIAEELGISVKTVENQIGKALRILRQLAETTLTLLAINQLLVVNF